MMWKQIRHSSVILLFAVITLPSIGISAPVTIQWEGTFVSGESLFISYTFDPDNARVTDVGSGTIYDQFFSDATLIMDGVIIPVVLSSSSRIFI